MIDNVTLRLTVGYDASQEFIELVTTSYEEDFSVPDNTHCGVLVIVHRVSSFNTIELSTVEVEDIDWDDNDQELLDDMVNQHYLNEDIADIVDRAYTNALRVLEDSKELATQELETLVHDRYTALTLAHRDEYQSEIYSVSLCKHKGEGFNDEEAHLLAVADMIIASN